MSACRAAHRSLPSWILIACWVIFAVVWLAGALYNLRRATRIAQRGSSSWRVLLVTAAIALVVIPPSVWRPIVVCEPWVQWTGVVVVLFATGLTVWARAALGVMWSSMPARRAGHELRTTGPYRMTRHPIYTGLLAMVAGTMLVNGIGVWAPMFVCIAIGLVLKLRVEEQLMRDAFGEAYASYQRRVPGLMPWPRPRR